MATHSLTRAGRPRLLTKHVRGATKQKSNRKLRNRQEKERGERRGGPVRSFVPPSARRPFLPLPSAQSNLECEPALVGLTVAALRSEGAEPPEDDDDDKEESSRRENDVI